MKTLVLDFTEMPSVLKPPQAWKPKERIDSSTLTPTFSLLGNPFRNSALLTSSFIKVVRSPLAFLKIKSPTPPVDCAPIVRLPKPGKPT